MGSRGVHLTSGGLISAESVRNSLYCDTMHYCAPGHESCHISRRGVESPSYLAEANQELESCTKGYYLRYGCPEIVALAPKEIVLGLAAQEL